MKKIITHSLVLAMGTSIFLYSEQIFAETNIYDPMNPRNVITPVPHDERETSDSVVEDTTSTTETSESSVEDSRNTPSTNDFKKKPEQADIMISSIQPEAEMKNNEKKSHHSLNIPNSYLPKFHKQTRNQVLILDDDFFSKTTTVAAPSQGSGGTASPPNSFSDIAQSAYLLSGVTLYGENSKELGARMSGYFA